MVLDIDVYFLFIGHILMELLFALVGSYIDLLILDHYKTYSFNDFFFNILFNYILSIIIIFIVNIIDQINNKKYNGLNLDELYSCEEDDINKNDKQNKDAIFVNKHNPQPLPIKFKLYLDVIYEIKNVSSLDVIPSLKLIKEGYEDTLNLYNISEWDSDEKYKSNKKKIIEGSIGYLHLYIK